MFLTRSLPWNGYPENKGVIIDIKALRVLEVESQVVLAQPLWRRLPTKVKAIGAKIQESPDLDWFKIGVEFHSQTNDCLIDSSCTSSIFHGSTFNKSGLGKLRHDFMRFFTALFWP